MTKPRHPEKVNKPINPIKKKPAWIRSKILDTQTFFKTKEVVNKNKLNTVCQEANCPNITECWSKKHATFMIMGDTCTRGCAFCNVKTGKPNKLDFFEPHKVSSAVKELNLNHVVITSVDRDDLDDGGASHFKKVVIETKKVNPNTTIEVLTPDFLTIGQYLQPSPKHYPLQRYYHPNEFKELKNIALSKGFLLVASSPLTRSSYHADEDFKKLKSRRDEQVKCQTLQ